MEKSIFKVTREKEIGLEHPIYVYYTVHYLESWTSGFVDKIQVVCCCLCWEKYDVLIFTNL